MQVAVSRTLEYTGVLSVWGTAYGGVVTTQLRHSHIVKILSHHTLIRDARHQTSGWWQNIQSSYLNIFRELNRSITSTEDLRAMKSMKYLNSHLNVLEWRWIDFFCSGLSTYLMSWWLMCTGFLTIFFIILAPGTRCSHSTESCTTLTVSLVIISVHINISTINYFLLYFLYKLEWIIGGMHGLDIWNSYRT